MAKCVPPMLTLTESWRKKMKRLMQIVSGLLLIAAIGVTPGCEFWEHHHHHGDHDRDHHGDRDHDRDHDHDHNNDRNHDHDRDEHHP